MTGFSAVATGLRFAYGRAAVFDGCDIQVPSGVVGLLGPNGAGKTTLLTILATLAKAASGTVEVLGFDVTDRTQRRELRRQLGFMPQRFGVVGSFTVRESVEYAAWLHGVSGRKCATAASEAIGLVDLAEQADAKVRKLSGGMRQRLGIAHALAHRPRMLILDEPAVGLDPLQRMAFRQVLRRAGERGSVLLSSHQIDDVEQSCDEVVVMHAGRVVFTGTLVELADVGSDDGSLGSATERGYAALVTTASHSIAGEAV